MLDNAKESAVVSRHPKPSPDKIQYMKGYAEKMKLDYMKFETSKDIQESLGHMHADKAIPESFKELMQFGIRINMSPGECIVVANTPKEELSHYSLHFDVYTQFTSPIRRYMDVLVHRAVLAILHKKSNMGAMINQNTEELLQIMETINDWNGIARKLRSESERIFMCFYLKAKPMETRAIINQIAVPPSNNDNGKIQLKLYIPELETTKFIYVSQLNGKTITDLPSKDQRIHKKLKVEKEDVACELILAECEYIDVHVEGNHFFPIDYEVHLIVKDVKGKTVLLYDKEPYQEKAKIPISDV